MFKDTNLCRISLPFSVLKRSVVGWFHQLHMHNQQMKNRTTPQPLHNLAQEPLQTSCLWSPLLFTSPQDCQESGHCHLGKMWGQVSVPLCFLGVASSAGSALVKLKACSSSPIFVEPSAMSVQEITSAVLHKWAYITLHISSTAFPPWKTNIHHIGWSPNNTVQALSLRKMECFRFRIANIHWLFFIETIWANKN